jgi:signal transduction histidine kinase
VKKMKIHQKGITYFDQPIELEDLFRMDESLFDYDYPIYVNNRGENEISTLNYRILTKAVESFGGDVDRLFDLYQRHTPDIMTHAKRFISTVDAIHFHNCTRRVLTEKGIVCSDGSAFNPRFHLELGQIAGKYQTMGKTLNFLAQFLPMKKVYPEAAKYGRYFNNTELYKCVYNKDNLVVVIHKYFENNKQYYRFTQNNWAIGIFSGIPAARGLQPSTSNIDYCLHSIPEILKKDFDYLNLDPALFSTKEERINGLKRKRYYFRDKEFAHEAILEKTVISQERKRVDGKKVLYDHDVYNINPKEFEDFVEEEIQDGLQKKEMARVELITSDLRIGIETVFKASEMYGAPYTRFSLKYPSQSGFQNIAGKMIKPARILFSYQNMIDRELAATRKEAVRATREAHVARKNELLANQEKEKAEEALKIIQEKTAQIQKISEELKKERDTLEIRVGERTSELAAALEKLKELDTLKSNFFANISHEIRTPLTLILSPIESVLQGDFGKQVDERFFQNLHRNCLRLLNLINSILDFSKIEAGRMSMKVRKVDMVKLVSGYVSSIHSAGESKGIAISFDPSCDHIDTYVDTGKMDKVLMNLFSNALKFTEKYGKILIRVREDEKNCTIQFEDTGMGIPADKITSIFDRFSQVDSDSTRMHEGTGIGLALAKELVEMHGGAISVESRYMGDYPQDHGTIFTVTLPKGKQHFDQMKDIRIISDTAVDTTASVHVGMHHLMGTDVETDVLTQTAPAFMPERPTILIVEDNQDMQEFLQLLLVTHYNVDLAVNGAEGMRKARESRPDLILTDVMMPVMNGYEMTKKIKVDDDLRDIPIVMLTAKSEISNKIEGLEYGADDYLTKPFNSKELLTRVKSLLTIKARTEELQETQARLAEAEKRVLENRITGGFAHEMRNALAGAQLEFKTILNYKGQGKTVAEILKDASTNLLKNISEIHEKYNIPGEEISKLFLPELKATAEIAEHLEVVHLGVSSDLERGLSITKQIRDYARIAEFRPGDAAVDVVDMLKRYGDRYKGDFERIGIHYAVEAAEAIVLKADETHINSIFSNLILNAKDALEECEDDRQKEITVTVDERENEDDKHPIIMVSDNGPGIPEGNLSDIFEPFFSTKPTSGTGLGLGIVKRLVQLYGGEIEVDSKEGRRTVFSVTIPYRI